MIATNSESSSLVVLNLSGAENITDVGLQHMPPELLVGAKLDLSTWSLLATDKCLGVIATNSESSSLVVLNLSGAENITDVGLQSLSGCTSSLQYLNFDNAYRITGAGLAAITKTCIKLQQLSLSGCMGIDGAGFGILGQNCRELVSLKLQTNVRDVLSA